MKRTFWSKLVLGGMLVAIPQAYADGPVGAQTPAYTSPPTAAMPAEGSLNGRYFEQGQEPPSDEGFVRELIAILKETSSPDAFLVTLSILQEMKVDARVAVPAIIRNAERLKLFKRTDPDQPTAQQAMIADCIADLLSKHGQASTLPGEVGPLGGAAIGAGLVGALTGALQQQPEREIAKDTDYNLPALDLGQTLDLIEGVTKPATCEVVPGAIKPLSAYPASPKGGCQDEND